MSTQSPGQGSSSWSASLSPDRLPLEAFLRSGVNSIPVALVPKDGGAIRMNNPGAVRAALQSATSLYESIGEVRQFGRGGILCRSPDLACVKDLLSCSSFASLQVSAFIPSHLACTKGLVRGVDSSLTPAETLDLLSAAGAVAVYRCSRVVNNIKLPTESVIATFAGTSCPSEVKAWPLIFRVDPLMSKPLQCNNCWRYGHSAGGCKSGLRCCKCGEGHKTNTCSDQNEKCCLCGGTHAANSSDCPSRAHEVQIVEIIDRKRCSRREAIAEVKERSHGYAGVTARQGIALDSTISQAIAAAVEASMAKMVERIVTSVSECLTNVLAVQLTHAMQTGMASLTTPTLSLPSQQSMSKQSQAQEKMTSPSFLPSPGTSSDVAISYDSEMMDSDARVLKRSGSPISHPSSRPQSKSKKQQIGLQPKDNILDQAVAAARLSQP